MWTLLLATALSVEPQWSDGLSQITPDRAWVELGVHGTPGGTTHYLFADIQGGGPAYAWGDGLSVGFTGSIGLAYFWIPEERRDALRPRSLEGSIWWNFEAPKHGGIHSIGVGGGAPVVPYARLFWLSHLDGAPHWRLFYNGYVPFKAVDISMRVDFGGDSLQFIHATSSVAATFKPVESLGIQIGIKGGYTPLQLATFGLRARPTEGFELGAAAVVVFGDADIGGPPTVSPSLLLKGTWPP